VEARCALALLLVPALVQQVSKLLWILLVLILKLRMMLMLKPLKNRLDSRHRYVRIVILLEPQMRILKTHVGYGRLWIIVEI